MPSLRIYAGPFARQQLRERGLRAEDIAVIPGAAGGPKGLALNPLDRFLFGHWLKGPTGPGLARHAPRGGSSKVAEPHLLEDSTHVVHLLGASIGAWRLACACLPDPDAALARLADDYIHERYEGKVTTSSATHVSRVFAQRLDAHFQGREAELLSHPRYRLHVFTSRGRHPLLRRQGRWRTPLGYLGAFATNAISRPAMGTWLERVVFSDPRDPFPLPLHDFRSRQVPLSQDNLRAAVLASCSIPFWLDAVHDIPGGPRGAYWDGGITDYHLHLDYAAMAAADPATPGGLVLYPHFQDRVVPGWLDKGLKRRHVATERLSNVVLLAPDPQWVKTLPGGKLPDRGDFKAYGEDFDGRVKAWQRAVAESQRLADEFAELTARPGGMDVEPLA